MEPTPFDHPEHPMYDDDDLETPHTDSAVEQELARLKAENEALRAQVKPERTAEEEAVLSGQIRNARTPEELDLILAAAGISTYVDD